jgi:hypothetical protein
MDFDHSISAAFKIGALNIEHGFAYSSSFRDIVYNKVYYVPSA